MRAGHLLLIVAAVVAMTSLPARAQSPTPTVVDAPAAVQPLRIVAAAPNLEIHQAPLINDGGQFRQSGLISILANATFNTGVIAAIEPAVELLQDQPPDLTGVRIIVVRIPDPGIDAVMGGIRSLPGVVAADKSYLMSLHTSDPVWQGQLDAGLKLLDLPAAWFVSAGAASVRVAVLDTGVNEIPDLAGRVDAGVNALDPNNPADTSDPVGHGTSLAAIIGASIDNGKGIAGVAPNVHIVPVKACESNSGLFSCLSSYVIPALSWVAGEAQAGRIDVLNMSLGGSANTAIGYYLGIIRNAGVIVSASAGNSGTALLDYPASSPDVVAVGGTLPDGTRNPQSNYGAGLGVAAPYQTYSLNNNNAITYSGGTSLSAAVISGLAALFKSTQPRVPSAVGSDYLNGLTEFRSAMARYANYVRPWNQETGYGIPNAFSTVWAHACVRYDFNHDGVIDVSDFQRVTFRYGQFAGQAHYDVRYDVEPSLQPDGDIDIKDVQGLAGRQGFICPRTTAPTPGDWEALGGSYAYASPCPGGEGDPIGTILITPSSDAGSATQLANTRLNDAGMTSGFGSLPVSLTDRDNFLDNGACVEGDITRATNDGWERCGGSICSAARWHTRCIVHAQPSILGYWASCTPHWDSPACINPLTGFQKHYVPPVYNGTENYGGSGYDAARDWLWWQLVQVLGLKDAGPAYFYRNPAGTRQCTGADTRAQTKVNVIELR